MGEMLMPIGTAYNQEEAMMHAMDFRQQSSCGILSILFITLWH